ncbi:MAG: hypothetical protein K1X47_00190 [Cyclobacteriaceae bacterium]|nr:hypothetical protein [Cyclobacteriaceae bacterium]
MEYGPNFERMIQLADEVFASRTDPDQIDVNEDVLDHLRAIHPAAVCEHATEEGPVAWVLLFPTTEALMNDFLNGKISERALMELTPLQTSYSALYLCSAMVLAEHRRQGIALRLCLDAIDSMRTEHPIQHLFVWTFSEEGRFAAEAVARHAGLPLLLKNH